MGVVIGVLTYVRTGTFDLFRVEGHFGVIQCTCPKIAVT